MNNEFKSNNHFPARSSFIYQGCGITVVGYLLVRADDILIVDGTKYDLPSVVSSKGTNIDPIHLVEFLLDSDIPIKKPTAFSTKQKHNEKLSILPSTLPLLPIPPPLIVTKRLSEDLIYDGDIILKEDALVTNFNITSLRGSVHQEFVDESLGREIKSRYHAILASLQDYRIRIVCMDPRTPVDIVLKTLEHFFV